ncbi:MAG: helix-turn-helix transcriptional regulator [Kiritimatiellae bacterium]|nr:helix-turn-helix transcriptional regulator [Kiritimatiellia bacterium]
MKKGRSTAARGHVARHILEQRIDEIEWCSLGDVPRRLRFPFPVTVVGWIITGAVHYRGTHRSFGTEFCVRLRSCDATAVDFVNGVRHECSFPHVMMKRHGERHEYRASGWREAFYIIYPPGMEAALRRAGVDDGHGALPMWPVGGAPDLLDSIREMRALFPRRLEPGVADELDARCWALVTRLVALRDHPAKPAALEKGLGKVFSRPSDDDRIRAFSMSLQARCMKPVDFAAEARALGFSRSVFYRRFTALVGEPPEKHLANLRLDAAARLLRESPLSIKQVAFAIHDKSPSHFAAAFKARFGTTPRAWRDGGGSGFSG